MSTASQIANAANAQLSTGPRTEEGKRQSSQNARTHGLTTQHPVIPDEDRAAFHQLRAELQAETKPGFTSACRAPANYFRRAGPFSLEPPPCPRPRCRAQRLRTRRPSHPRCPFDRCWTRRQARSSRTPSHPHRASLLSLLARAQGSANGRRAQPYTPFLFHDDSAAPRLAHADCKTNPIPRDK